MLPSAMERINQFLDGPTNITEDSGVCGECLHFGLVLDTGCLPFISELYPSFGVNKECQQARLFTLFKLLTNRKSFNILNHINHYISNYFLALSKFCSCSSTFLFLSSSTISQFILSILSRNRSFSPSPNLKYFSLGLTLLIKFKYFSSTKFLDSMFLSCSSRGLC